MQADSTKIAARSFVGSPAASSVAWRSFVGNPIFWQQPIIIIHLVGIIRILRPAGTDEFAQKVYYVPKYQIWRQIGGQIKKNNK